MTPFLERQHVDLLAVPEEDVEADVLRRNLAGEPLDAAVGGVEPHLKRVEVEPAVPLDHDLTVDSGPGRHAVAERTQLGEVTQQRAGIAAPEAELAVEVLEDAAEPVPLRLVPPAIARRQSVDELGLHRGERHVRSGCVHPASL